MSGVPVLVVVAALIWVTALVIVGVLALLRGRDVLQRLIALDLLAVLVVALLALLSYLRDVPHYLNAAVALALLSFVATVAAARYLATGGPLE